MITPSKTLVSDVRGAVKLTFDATAGLVDLVERMHRTIQARPGPLKESPQGLTSGVGGRVYHVVRGGVRLAGSPKVVGDRHLRMTMMEPGGRLEAIGFGMAERLDEVSGRVKRALGAGEIQRARAAVLTARAALERADTVCVAGSIVDPFIPRRSTQTPSSHTALPVTAWPPP